MFRALAYVSAFVFAFALCCQEAAASGISRISLLENATTGSDVIVLDDLLPPDAPKWLHARAGGIVLGGAPQLGVARVFRREQVQRVLLDSPELEQAFAIPDQIVVRRAQRYLTGAEILRAIRDALDRMYPENNFELSAGDIELAAPVAVATRNPGLRVTRIDADQRDEVTKFRLWTANEPEVRPFWVGIHVMLNHYVIVATRYLHAGSKIGSNDVHIEERMGPVDLSNANVSIQDMVDRELMRPVRAGEVIDPDALAPDFLVLPGEKSALLLTSAGIHIATHGVALQKGVRGQRIRVRAADSGRVIVAKVIAKQQLEAEF